MHNERSIVLHEVLHCSDTEILVAGRCRDDEGSTTLAFQSYDLAQQRRTYLLPLTDTRLAWCKRDLLAKIHQKSIMFRTKIKRPLAFRG